MPFPDPTVTNTPLAALDWLSATTMVITGLNRVEWEDQQRVNNLLTLLLQARLWGLLGCLLAARDGHVAKPTTLQIRAAENIIDQSATYEVLLNKVSTQYATFVNPASDDAAKNAAFNQAATTLNDLSTVLKAARALDQDQIHLMPDADVAQAACLPAVLFVAVSVGNQGVQPALLKPDLPAGVAFTVLLNTVITALAGELTAVQLAGPNATTVTARVSAMAPIYPLDTTGDTVATKLEPSKANAIIFRLICEHLPGYWLAYKSDNWAQLGTMDDEFAYSFVMKMLSNAFFSNMFMDHSPHRFFQSYTGRKARKITQTYKGNQMSNEVLIQFLDCIVSEMMEIDPWKNITPDSEKLVACRSALGRFVKQCGADQAAYDYLASYNFDWASMPLVALPIVEVWSADGRKSTVNVQATLNLWDQKKEGEITSTNPTLVHPCISQSGLLSKSDVQRVSLYVTLTDTRAVVIKYNAGTMTREEQTGMQNAGLIPSQLELDGHVDPFKTTVAMQRKIDAFQSASQYMDMRMENLGVGNFSEMTTQERVAAFREKALIRGTKENQIALMQACKQSEQTYNTTKARTVLKMVLTAAGVNANPTKAQVRDAWTNNGGDLEVANLIADWFVDKQEGAFVDGLRQAGVQQIEAMLAEANKSLCNMALEDSLKTAMALVHVPT